MKYMSVDEFIKTFYTEGSRPTRRTVISRIQNGVIPGKLEGARYLIDVEKYLKMTGNILVDKVTCKNDDDHLE